MSTIVLPNLPTQKTTQNMETTQTTQQVPTVTGVKRSLDADTIVTASPAAKQRTQIAPVFQSNKFNWRLMEPTIVVKKDKDGKPTVQTSNALGSWNYQVLAPPGYCKYIQLGEGGNLGQFKWSETKKTASLGFIYTNRAPPMENRTAEECENNTSKMRVNQDKFFAHLKETHEKAFNAIWENMPDIKQSYLKKASAVLPKDSDEEKIQTFARKLFDKYCSKQTPLKEDGQGNVEFNVKCGAFKDNKDGTFSPRPVFVYDGTKAKYPQHDSIQPGDIKDGAVLSPVVGVRVYFTPGNNTFGITYQLEARHVLFYKNGTGSVRTSGALSDEQLKWQRQFQFKGYTTRNGNYNIYCNDLNGSKYLHRMPPSMTKYVDLVNGTLGKFPGVTTSTAKYTATFIEDASNKEYFDHIENLVREAATFLFNDKNVLVEQKAELLGTAQEFASETNQTVEETHFTLFLENIQGPIKKTGDSRELRASCKMFQYKNNEDDEDVKNTFKYQDEDCDPMDNDPQVMPGSKLSMVLEPVIYVLPSGVAGVTLNIDKDNYIRVLSGGSSIAEDAGENALPTWSADMF